MNAVDRVPVEPLEVQGVRRGQDLPHGDAAARRWRHRDDVVPVVREADRLALDGLVAGEIGLGPEAAHRRHAPCQGAGEPAAVEGVRAAGGDGPERAGELGLPPGVAPGVGRAVGLAEGPQRGRHRPTQGRVRRGHLGGVVGHVERHRGHLGGVERVEDDAVARQRNCRLDQLAPGQLAVLAVRVLQAAHDAGDAGGTGPDAAVARRLAGGVEVHVARRGAWRRLAVVDGGARAVRQPDHHEPAAADVAGGRMRDAQGEGDGDGGIDRVAAALQDGDAHVAGVGLRAGDGAVLSRGDALVAPAGGGAGQLIRLRASPSRDTASSTATHADSFIWRGISPDYAGSAGAGAIRAWRSCRDGWRAVIRSGGRRWGRARRLSGRDRNRRRCRSRRRSRTRAPPRRA